ncbi:MucR family transcriptional regulator [Sphingomonas panacis]|uniref:MucR family transcriptional regulator n=1 Tax=Sphingomonas panacis TaxID=1560345 RepID=UPI0008410518|nr:MucR family transcriptional regulator [Sphingomonas panacis]
MPEENNLVAMTIEVVASYVAHNNIAPDAVPDFIAKTHAAIAGISSEAIVPAEDAPPAETEFAPAVTARKSLASPDHIISMIDGKPYKTLKRHLGTHGLTPAEYRARYGLKADYPMVAPGYSAQRREVAKRLGLGRKPRTAEAPAEATQPVSDGVIPEQPEPARAQKTKAATVSIPAQPPETQQPASEPAIPQQPKPRRARKAKGDTIPAPAPSAAKKPRRRKAGTAEAPTGEA